MKYKDILWWENNFPRGVASNLKKRSLRVVSQGHRVASQGDAAVAQVLLLVALGITLVRCATFLEKVRDVQCFWKKCAVCNVFGKSVQCVVAVLFWTL